VASGARRTAADSWSVTGHTARVSGMSEVDYRRLSGEVRTVRLADVSGQQMFGRRMAQGRMRLDSDQEKAKGE